MESPAFRNCLKPKQRKYLLGVDGLGTILLLLRDKIVIGGTEVHEECDVKLQTGGHASPVSIHRDGDRYLATSKSPFAVNGKSTSSKLLFSNETIEIGQRGRLRFSRQVLASGSAVLRPTAACLDRRHIRYVAMLADSLLFGAQETHFPFIGFERRIVLSLQK